MGTEGGDGGLTATPAPPPQKQSCRGRHRDPPPATRWGQRPPPPPPASPLWYIEVCTPVQQAKRPKLHTPVYSSLVRMPWPAGEAATPVTPSRAVTSYHVGPVRNTFHTLQTRSLMTPSVSMRVVESRNLIPMDEVEQPASIYGSLRSDVSHVSTVTTLTCSTEGSQCETPLSAADGNGGPRPAVPQPLGEIPASRERPRTPECCMCLTLTAPEPTGFFNLRLRQCPTWGGRMGPASIATREGSHP